jgi:hypothetical protein
VQLGRNLKLFDGTFKPRMDVAAMVVVRDQAHALLRTGPPVPQSLSDQPALPLPLSDVDDLGVWLPLALCGDVGFPRMRGVATRV